MGGFVFSQGFTSLMRFVWFLIIIIILFEQKASYCIADVNNSRQF